MAIILFFCHVSFQCQRFELLQLRMILFQQHFILFDTVDADLKKICGSGLIGIGSGPISRKQTVPAGSGSATFSVSTE